MSKTNTPFLSLGSQGSVGKSITSQKGLQDTILRRLPVPTDPYSLPQAYQRWLYEDYAYLWTQQSAALRAQYRSAGSRYHLTGFQYWMKYHLKNLPDIVGIWHLDDMSGATTPDSSRNNNHATIIGTSPTSGLIDGAAYFDGLNDRLRIPNHPSLFPKTAITILVWMNYPPLVDYHGVIQGFGSLYNTYGAFLRNHATRCYWFSLIPGTFIRGGAPTPDTDLFVSYTYDKSTTITQVRVNLALVASGNWNIDIPTTTQDLVIGYHRGGPAPQWYKGMFDNFIIYNRALDLPSLTRWFERGYP